MNHLNGMGNMGGNNIVHPFGIVPVQDGMNGMGGDQSQLSRSSSMGRLDNDADRRNMNGPVMGASQQYAGDVSSSMNNQQMPNYSMPPGQNGIPMYGGSNPNQQPGLDWSQVFQPGAHQPQIHHHHSAPNHGQSQTEIKAEPNMAG